MRSLLDINVLMALLAVAAAPGRAFPGARPHHGGDLALEMLAPDHETIGQTGSWL